MAVSNTPRANDMDRAARYTEYSGGRYDRVAGERAPTFRTEALHYYDDFGTTMTDEGHQVAKGNLKAARSGIKEARGSVEKIRASALDEYNKYKGDIKGAQSGIPGYSEFYGDNTMAVRVVSNGGVEQTYYLPKSTVEDMHANKLNQEGSYLGNFVGDGRNYNIDPFINGEAKGKELHEQLNIAQTKNNSALRDIYQKEAGGLQATFNKQKAGALGALDLSRNFSRDQLASYENQINQREQAINTELKTIRKQYAKRLEGIRETISQMVMGKQSGEGETQDAK